MQLFTKREFQQLLKNGQPENLGKDHYPVVKIFIPVLNCIWLLTRIDPNNHNIAFGLFDHGDGDIAHEYINLSGLVNFISSFGTKATRDPNFMALYPLSVYANVAFYSEQISDNSALLQKCNYPKSKTH